MAAHHFPNFLLFLSPSDGERVGYYTQIQISEQQVEIKMKEKKFCENKEYFEKQGVF